ncbi:MAG: NosL family protein [Desulfuromonadaceae bacterium GWC2_58_13]|nr:MAG: NosL family protein [Desulfuromonadaceae bacterium GWC2_58_13]
MKKAFLGMIAIILLVSPLVWAEMMEDVTQHSSCSYCGMHREKFAHSRMLISYEDGTQVGLCSIRCAAVDLANNIDKTPTTIQVGDYQTRKLIDAQMATWVLGGNQPGVMTKRAKWAFETKEAAEQFIKENGGETIDFEAAMEASYNDMYNDTRMIREKRKKMRMMKN